MIPKFNCSIMSIYHRYIDGRCNITKASNLVGLLRQYLRTPSLYI